MLRAWVGEEINTQDYEKSFRRDLETTQAIAKQMLNADLAPEPLQGAALRALRHLLDEQEPQQHWGGLKKVLTPEGHYFWLCGYHARGYLA